MTFPRCRLVLVNSWESISRSCKTLTLNRQQKKILHGKWEIDPKSSFVEPIAEELDEQFVYDDKEKDVDVPGSNLSHKQVVDVVIYFKIFEIHKDENHLQLVQELENLTERKIVQWSYNQIQLTLDSISQNNLEI